MKLLRRVASWLPWRWQRAREADLERELRDHLDLEAEEQQEAGLSPEEAAYAARRALGNTVQIKEDVRMAWGFQWLEALTQDLSYGFRQFRRDPGFTVVVVLTLALGIGANSAIFSVVNAAVLRPLPFRDPGRLMMVDERWQPRFPHFEATPKDFLSWREQSRAFDQIAAFAGVAFNMTSGERPEQISGARVSANLPTLLGVEPALGRSFAPEEDTPGNDHVVLLGYSLWQRHFGSNPGVIGTAARLNGVDFTIIGVMPPSFRFPQDAEIWKPMGFTSEDLDAGHFIWGIGRLKPGASRAQAQAEMDLIMPRLHPQTWRVNVFPLLDHYVGEVKTALYVLLAAAGFVLLIACVNVANLLLTRGSARRREISVRSALGASRRRIIQQLLTEGAILSLSGAAVGLLLARGGVGAIRKFSLANIPRLDQATLDHAVLLFTLVLAVFIVAVFGLSPSLHLSRGDLQNALKASGRVAGAGVPARMRSRLVVSEVTLALILLVGAGLLIKSFSRLLETRPGFNPEKLLTMSINLPTAKYKEPSEQMQFVQRLIEQLHTLPGIRHVAISAGLPFSGMSDVGIRFDGRSIGAPDAGTTANYFAVTPSYFQTMGIPLIRGRLFTKQDIITALPVVIINERMAKCCFANEDPIGKRVDISGPTYLREIVGVVGDVKQADLKASIPPQIYEPFFQKPATSFNVLVRSAGEPMRLVETVRRKVMEIDKDQPVSNVRTMDELVTGSVATDRFSLFLLSLFAFLALLLAAVGIYGVVAYSVTQRTNEIGIRMALGASQAGIMKLVIGQSLRLVFLGLGIGMAASLLLTHLMASLLYQVKASDPTVFVAVVVVLLAVALVASYIPGHRATKVDPMAALRYE